MEPVPGRRPPIEAMLAIFERAYRQGVAFREDRLLGPDLSHEVRPVLEALAQLGPGASDDTCCHEAYALLTLLGRRAGVLGATPTAALALLQALFAALSEEDSALSSELEMRCQVVVLEGYCAGRDERVTAELRASVAKHQVSLSLAPRCRYLALAGPLELDALEQVLDEAARDFLRDDALACLLDVSRLDGWPSERMARALLEFCLACRALGGSVVMVGLGAELHGELQRLGMSGDSVAVAASFAVGLAQVLDSAGHELRPSRSRWAKSLFGRR
ncbi:MAG: hypothetical protein QM778_08960 [Myxococcales bacterium]